MAVLLQRFDMFVHPFAPLRTEILDLLYRSLMICGVALCWLQWKILVKCVSPNLKVPINSIA